MENKDFNDKNIVTLHELLDSKFDSVDKQLASILVQVNKTNGRVTDLEKDVKKLELSDITHIMTCPQAKAIAELKAQVDQNRNDINKDLVEYSFIKKYPKISLLLVSVLTFILLFSTVEYFTYRDKEQIQTNKENIEMLQHSLDEMSIEIKSIGDFIKNPHSKDIGE